jgi:hypothetical protein
VVSCRKYIFALKITMNKLSLSVQALLFFSMTAFSQSAGKIVLHKGQKFVEETSSNILVSQEAMGQSMKFSTDITATNMIEVKAVEDTGYSLTNTVTKMKLNASVMGQNLNYDSERSDNDSTIARSMDKILNKPKDVKINTMGKLSDDVKDSVLPDKISEENMMAGMLQGMIGNMDGKSLGLTMAFQTIPSKVSVGYNWNDSVITNEGKSNLTYTIKELKGNDAVVSVKGTTQDSRKAEIQGMEFTNNSTGIINEELTVDIKSGIVKQRNSTIENTGTIDVMGQQIPMTTKVNSVITVKSLD